VSMYAKWFHWIWANSLVIMNKDQWRSNEFTNLMNRDNELHSHFVVVFDVKSILKFFFFLTISHVLSQDLWDFSVWLVYTNASSNLNMKLQERQKWLYLIPWNFTIFMNCHSHKLKCKYLNYIHPLFMDAIICCSLSLGLMTRLEKINGN
jgi:hypothetical protein